jgi:phage-related protein
MHEVGPGVREIRIHVLGEWRVLYVVRFADAIYVLHAFRKKTQKTRRGISSWRANAIASYRSEP